MSSLVRRLQIRAWKKAGKSKLLIVDPTSGKGAGKRWGLSLRQLFWHGDTPIMPGHKDRALQPLIDLLENQTA